ncbi:MAG: tRNA (cytidine(34)-2'-O)-methyltransferase [Gemmataceae bacterium]|nr:tRNA (cytidine(34)-2'-O)-methyltransferase [Gemmataceae bacterium]
MIHIALLEPEIPPNTGNIARLCAALQLPLHLIGPLGFSIEDRELKRAGLDYWHAMDIRRHESLEQFEAAIPSQRIFCISTRGDLTYTQVPYQAGDVLLFGKESRGLPDDVLKRHPGRILRIPMLSDAVRSLNLSTAVGIVAYEAMRQLHNW